MRASRRPPALLFPSMSDLVFIVLLTALSSGAMGSRLLNDAGIGWHIRAGEQMLRSHTIIRADIFSSTMNGRPWFAWEWLYDVLIAAIHARLGLNGVVLLTAAVIALTFTMVLRNVLRRGASVPVAAALLVLAVGASMIHVMARPHVLSWLLVVIFYELLDSKQVLSAGTKHLLLWLPFLMLFWANLHGGFLLGFVLIAIHLAGSATESLILNESRPDPALWLKHAAVGAGLAFLASFLNPYGYKLYVHIFDYLSNPFLMNHISEFLSPDFHKPAARCFAILILIALCTLAATREKLQFTHLLYVLFAVFTGLSSSRNLPVSSILLVLVVAPLLSNALTDREHDLSIKPRCRALLARFNSFGVRMNHLDSALHGNIWTVLALLIGMWLCLHGGRIGSREIMNAHFDETRFPVHAVNVIANEKIREPIFCPDLWGGYLIYTLYPQTKVVVDDRHDLYGEAFFKDYLKVIRVESGWEQTLSDWKANYVLVQKDSALASALKEKSVWKVVHQDETAVLLHK